LRHLALHRIAFFEIRGASHAKEFLTNLSRTRARTISGYPKILGKKYAPTASNIPRRAEMGPCGAPLNV
jgi:hypothetical protein